MASSSIMRSLEAKNPKAKAYVKAWIKPAIIQLHDDMTTVAEMRKNAAETIEIISVFVLVMCKSIANAATKPTRLSVPNAVG